MYNFFRTLAVALLTLAGSAVADTYTYTGVAYTSVTGGYTTSMSITGSFETSAPIPPNSTDLDLMSLITSWSFSDGQNTLANANSVIDFPGFPGFSPLGTTDSSGNLVSAQLYLTSSPFPGTIGALVNSIYVDGFVSRAEVDGACASIGAGGFCSSFGSSPSNEVGGAAVPGAWAWTAPPVIPPVTPAPAAPVSTLSEWALITLAMLLAGVVFIRRRQLL